MIRKILFGNQKHSGTVLLNSILVLAVSIMVVGYSTSYLSNQINDYRQLDKIYRQQIKDEIHNKPKEKSTETKVTKLLNNIKSAMPD